jgi:hypothetical protein
VSGTSNPSASGGAALQQRVERACFPPGVPGLSVRLHLAVVVLDEPASSFGVVLGPDWTVTTRPLSPDRVHDAVLAAPAALVSEVLSGAADPGVATVEGSVTGNLAGQSALALLVEVVSGVLSDGRA